MAFLDQFGALASAIIATIVMLVVAILSFYITVFIVDAGASFADLSPDANYVVLSAAILAGAAIVAGGTPLSLSGGE